MRSEGCDAQVHVEQVPNPFLTNMIEFEDKGVVKFRRGKETLENFPDEIIIKIYYRPTFSSFWLKDTKACVPMDLSNAKFKALWSNKYRTTTADGMVLETQRLGPEPFCEDRCAETWVYELRIDSKGVPLTDDLLIMIDSAEGKSVAKLRGGLGPLEHNVNPKHP